MATVMYIARSISLESLKVIAAKIAIIAVHHTTPQTGRPA